MERKRPYQELSCVEEEEEEDEEEEDIFFISDDDDGDDDNDSDDNEEEEDEHKQITLENSPEIWPVRCGDKIGFLDVERLRNGEKCIESEGDSFTPPDFEKFGGKVSARKWKTSISFKGKSLQHWFKKGLLYTKGYKTRRTHTRKRMKICPPNSEDFGLPPHSRNSFETSSILNRHDTFFKGFMPVQSGRQSWEDPEEADGTSVDWSPGSTEQVVETDEEEERDDDRNDGDDVTSGDAESETQEDEPDQREMECESQLTYEDRNNVTKERDPEMTPEKLALQKMIKKVFSMHSVADSQRGCVEQPTEESCSDTLDELADSDEETATSNPSIVGATQDEASRMSDEGITGGVGGGTGDNEILQSDENQDGQKGTKTEMVSSIPVNKTEENGLVYSHDLSLSSSPSQLGSSDDIRDTTDEEEFEVRRSGTEEERKREDQDWDMPVSDESQQPFATENVDKATNTDPKQPPFKTEILEQESVSTAPGSLLNERISASQTDDHDSAQLTSETRPTSTHQSDMMEASTSRVSADCHADTTDLGQMKREKIKMQLRVLKVIEEYYTLKLKELGKKPNA
ncbi:helicase SWR1-like isoform X2 [Kryptolebias marmoratus]|uniref:helicase SWR1-like isoform X2 n=1 Tax=Kryptolebias marmoratus TaxID=37003 RepID=UPI000D52F67F|nr:helicase SWR1-like isoform X2 [Kryptolebias marmoratus]